MKMDKKTFYASIGEVKRLTPEAIDIVEPRTKINVRIHRTGSTSLKTNSPEVLELFDFDNMKDKNI